MGAEYFGILIEKKDATKAFSEASEQARYDHGHSGYTGTIAEKIGFETVSKAPIEDSKVEEWAYAYDEKHRNEKWGRAYHVPVKDATGETIGHYFFGWASC